MGWLGTQSCDGLLLRMMIYGLLDGALGISSDVLNVVPKVTPFLQGIPCVSGVSKHIKSPQQDIDCPFGEDLLQACHMHFHTGRLSVEVPAVEDPRNNGMYQFQEVRSRPAGACVACGCGDNTIGHWTRWCIIPFAVAWIILQPSGSLRCLSDLAFVFSTHNAICTLTLAAFRRLLPFSIRLLTNPNPFVGGLTHYCPPFLKMLPRN